MRKLFAGMCLAALACSASGQLQVFTPVDDLFLPIAVDSDWIDPNSFAFPDEFFDIRLAPELQPTSNDDGTFIYLAQPRSTSFDLETGWLDRATTLAPDSITFLAPGLEEVTGGFFCEGPRVTRDVPVSFEPGDAVGPNATQLVSGLRLVTFPLFAAPFDGCQIGPTNENIDVFEEPFTIGIAITEPTGVHYGWITLEASFAGSGFRTSIFQGLRVISYAYQLTPGVPAEIPSSGCDNPADVNGDGELTPADFNAWVVAFNTRAPECDQNGDGLCGPADFNPWVQNYNFGCR